MTEQRYMTVGDDSGHDYAIPVEREAERWALDFEDGDVPDWAIRIDGRFSYTDPRNG